VNRHVFTRGYVVPALFWHPKWTFQSCSEMSHNVFCLLVLNIPYLHNRFCFLISPLCYWCSSASQITGLIVCTRCNYWSAGNLFGLERFFSVLVSAQLLLSSHVVNKWTLGWKNLRLTVLDY